MKLTREVDYTLDETDAILQAALIADAECRLNTTPAVNEEWDVDMRRWGGSRVAIVENPPPPPVAEPEPEPELQATPIPEDAF